MEFYVLDSTMPKVCGILGKRRESLQGIGDIHTMDERTSGCFRSKTALVFGNSVDIGSEAK